MQMLSNYFVKKGLKYGIKEPISICSTINETKCYKTFLDKIVTVGYSDITNECRCPTVPGRTLQNSNDQYVIVKQKL